MGDVAFTSRGKQLIAATTHAAKGHLAYISQHWPVHTRPTSANVGLRTGVCRPTLARCQPEDFIGEHVTGNGLTVEAREN